MTETPTKPPPEEAGASVLNLDGLTDDQRTVIKKLAALLRALHTSDAERELEDFWTAWTRMVPPIPRAAVEPLIEPFLVVARRPETQGAPDERPGRP